MLGTAADLLGLGLHALALGLGPLTLVQPVVAGGIVIAVPLDAALDQRPLGRRAWMAVLIGASGLAGFVVSANPSGGTNNPGRAVLAFAVACCVAAVIGCVLAGSFVSAVWRATLLGIAAGIAYAGSGSLIKVCAGVLGRGLDALLLSWPVYALAAVALLGLVLNQNAFQSKPLQPALVAMTLATPAISVVIGMRAFDEHLSEAGARPLLALLSAAAMIYGVIASTGTNSADRPS
jgi:drug/metabolite transporter (DMT)-like permease